MEKRKKKKKKVRLKKIINEEIKDSKIQIIN